MARSGGNGDDRRPDPERGRPHVPVIALGVALFLAMLWFGIVVLEDNPVRTVVMAALVVALAGAGWAMTRSDRGR